MKKDGRTWGERIVDNLMDKLADKISATEMIKANAAAEAAETERLRTQVVQHQQQMEEIRKKADELKKELSLVVDKLDNKEENSDSKEDQKLLELLNQNISDSSKSVVDTLSSDIKDNNKILVEALKLGTDDNNKTFAELFNKRLDEEHKYTHDIGVQVYRNVQASTQEENKKLADDIIKRILDENDHLAVSVADETSGQLQRVLEGLSNKQKENEHKLEELQLAVDKIHACTTVSVVTLIAVLAGIAINILNILGILKF